MTTEYFDSLGSTNDYLKEKSNAGILEAKDAVIAFSQTKGRGRLNRSFESPHGGVYISFYYGNIRGKEKEILSVMPSVAAVVSMFIKNKLGIDTCIKWPNDVIYNNKKCSGVLCEQTKTGDLIVGVGLNYKIDKFDSSLSDKAISLFNTSSSCPPIEQIAADLLNALREVQPLINNRALFEYYNSVLLYKGSNVSLKTIYNNQIVEGKCLGVNENGELLIETFDSSIKTYNVGELTSH